MSIILFAIALKYIWKNRKEVISIILLIVSVLSIVVLAGDVMRIEKVIDTSIIGIIALAMLIVAFIMKKKS